MSPIMHMMFVNLKKKRIFSRVQEVAILRKTAAFSFVEAALVSQYVFPAAAWRSPWNTRRRDNRSQSNGGKTFSYADGDLASMADLLYKVFVSGFC